MAAPAAAESVTSRVASARGFLAKLWRLSAPYWWAEEMEDLTVWRWTFRVREKWVARGLLLIIVAAAVFSVYMSKLLNDWNGRFFNAIQDKNQDQFFAELEYWFVLVAILIVVFIYRTYLRQLLIIRWRRWLTRSYVSDWLGDRTYYRMELVSHGTDNPEQRIEEDIASFTSQTLTITLGLLSEVMTLVTFTVILWSLSGGITIPVLGGIYIPGYMLWVAIVYSAIGSWLTYKVGFPLVRVNFDLQRFNADFRYRMIRVREHAESIALYKGEPDEERRLGGAFGLIYDVWWQLMVYTKRLNALNFFYSQVASIFPLVVASPRYFSGAIQLGQLMQISNAFGTVQGSLSWFVDAWPTLADWKATIDRLTTFSETMVRTRAEAREDARDLEVEAGTRPDLELDGVDILLPSGRALLEGVDVDILPGQRVVLQGPSGSGKTTLFRVLAGLWPFGRGHVRIPAGAKVLFLPQRPYIPVGTLREALCYPDKPGAHTDAETVEALEACQLGQLADRLDEDANWALTLSGGEAQRLSFARAILVRPDWLFLDEATSALDDASETALYELLRQRLPAATVVSIAHKQSVARFHDRRLRIDVARRKVVGEPLEAAAAPGE